MSSRRLVDTSGPGKATTADLVVPQSREADKQTNTKPEPLSSIHSTIHPAACLSSEHPSVFSLETGKKGSEKGGAVRTKEKRMASRKLNVKEACLLLMKV